MKTQNAFALRGFDEKRILQRPFFKDFYFDVLKSDSEILENLIDTQKNSRDTLERNLSLLRELSHRLCLYEKLISDHCRRLSKLNDEAGRRKREMEKNVESLISEPIQKKGESDLSYLFRSISVKQKEYEKKLTEIGKIEEYYIFWALTDTAADYEKGKYYDIILHVDRLHKNVTNSCEKLSVQIKKFNRKIFSDNLKRERKKYGLTQRELAEKIGMTQNSYSSYEIGRADPPLTTLIRLSLILNCTTDSLLGLS